ncbi:hypothetical protein LXL04_037263 [Taraxacum kok-saghyz]
MIPVAANDVAFSIHAVVLTAFTLFQIVIYDPKTRRLKIRFREDEERILVVYLIGRTLYIAKGDVHDAVRK